MGEDEDLAAVEWDPLNPHMEEGTVFASMNECRNALDILHQGRTYFQG